MADGKIRIDTRIDNSHAEKDLKDLEKVVDACSRHMKDAFESIDSVKGCEKAIQRQVNAYQKAKEKASEYEKQIEITFVKVKSHVANKTKINRYNDRADELANLALGR